MEKPIYFHRIKVFNIKLPTVIYDQKTKLKSHASTSELACILIQQESHAHRWCNYKGE